MKYVALWLEGAGKSGNITTAGPSVGGRIRMVHLSHSEVGINTQTRSCEQVLWTGQACPRGCKPELHTEKLAGRYFAQATILLILF